jgi:tetratricopeptide (TPR) repeat protein
VILLLAGAGESGSPSPSSGFARAKAIWLDRRGIGQPRDLPDAPLAAEQYNLGMAALQEARYDQAETILTDSLAAWRRFSSPPTRVCLAINLNAFAQLDGIEGRSARAESRAREASDLFAEASSDYAGVFASNAMIAELEAKRGRYDRAIGSLQQLIHDAELGHRGLSPRHPYVAILKLRLADIFLRAGRNADAQATAGEASAILDRAGLSDSRSAADALRISGLAALRQGNREQAERQFDRAMKVLRPSDESHPTQQSSPELAAMFAAQGELAGDLRNYTASVDDYHQALDQLAQLFDTRAAEHPLRAEYLHALAMLLAHDEKPIEAKPLLEESLAIDRRALPADHPSTISVMEDLATVLEKAGSKAAAENLRTELKRLRAGQPAGP